MLSYLNTNNNKSIITQPSGANQLYNAFFLTQSWSSVNAVVTKFNLRFSDLNSLLQPYFLRGIEPTTAVHDQCVSNFFRIFKRIDWLDYYTFTSNQIPQTATCYSPGEDQYTHFLFCPHCKEIIKLCLTLVQELEISLKSSLTLGLSILTERSDYFVQRISQLSHYTKFNLGCCDFRKLRKEVKDSPLFGDHVIIDSVLANVRNYLLEYLITIPFQKSLKTYMGLLKTQLISNLEFLLIKGECHSTFHLTIKGPQRLVENMSFAIPLNFFFALNTQYNPSVDQWSAANFDNRDLILFNNVKYYKPIASCESISIVDGDFTIQFKSELI